MSEKILRVNNKLWLISDTHFGHKNIIQYGGRPDSHEVIMISEWIRLVRPEDQILHLGDVVFANAKRWQIVINHLPGEKFLIKGNHDHETNRFYENCGFKIIDEFIDSDYAFTHRPVTDMFPAPRGFWHTNIHGHVHNNPPRAAHDGELHPYKDYINLSVEATELRPVQLETIWKT